jgi:aspartyl/asparaginyl beta-hydroxylase (cupin superfamily)
MTTVPAIDSQIRQLVQLVERAQANAQAAQARRLLSEAMALAPEHPLVLNAAGIQELHWGDAAAARRLLERAIGQDERNASFWLNLATSLRRLDLGDEELVALDRALALEPRHLLALLQKASLLEQQGRAKAAATVYHNALQTIPAGAQLHESLRPAIERAEQAVDANNAQLRAFLETEVQDVRARHAAEDQARFDHCLDALAGRRKIYTPQPTFLHFPKLPAWEFYARADFPWLDEIEAATAEIRAEFERVFAEDAGRLEPYIAYPEGVPLDQWAELNHSRRWSVFYLWRDGRPIDEHIARCPKTAALLATVPRVDVAEHGPAVFFSILDAKSRIPPHTGVTNTRLIVHLPLVIPPGCRFRVGSETREWRPGTAWVFDDTIEHEAVNDSDVPRAILIFDIWNPYLSAAERDLVRTTVEGVGAYYRGQSPLRAAI